MATAVHIQLAMEQLDLDQVAGHFLHGESDDDMEPFLVCTGVSVDAFNEYIADKDDLPIGVRFLELDLDGRLLVVDIPSWVHEHTADEFQKVFLRQSGNAKEADDTFGSYDDTPNRTAPPANVGFPVWITLAVEVGRSQSWASLREAARWWLGYPGIQYVLLIKVSARARSFGYQLYDVNHGRLGLRGGLPQPFQTGAVGHRPHGQPDVSFDAHRILSIPQGMPLPRGVNPVITVNLREVMTRVIRALGPSDEQ